VDSQNEVAIPVHIYSVCYISQFADVDLGVTEELEVVGPDLG
jgi:hypothetical protein